MNSVYVWGGSGAGRFDPSTLVEHMMRSAK